MDVLTQYPIWTCVLARIRNVSDKIAFLKAIGLTDIDIRDRLNLKVIDYPELFSEQLEHVSCLTWFVGISLSCNMSETFIRKWRDKLDMEPIKFNWIHGRLQLSKDFVNEYLSEFEVCHSCGFSLDTCVSRVVTVNMTKSVHCLSCVSGNNSVDFDYCKYLKNYGVWYEHRT